MEENKHNNKRNKLVAILALLLIIFAISIGVIICSNNSEPYDDEASDVSTADDHSADGGESAENAPEAAEKQGFFARLFSRDKSDSDDGDGSEEMSRAEIRKAKREQKKAEREQKREERKQEKEERIYRCSYCYCKHCSDLQ